MKHKGKWSNVIFLNSVYKSVSVFRQKVTDCVLSTFALLFSLKFGEKKLKNYFNWLGDRKEHRNNRGEKTNVHRFLEWQPCHYFAEGFKKTIAENAKLGRKYGFLSFFF